MCVAELNVSTLPCRHRWYHLLRPCTSSTNLANCTSKLGLEGWEIKCDFCPYCSSWNLEPAQYRLVGNDRAPSVGGLSRSPSFSLSSTRRDSRRESLARTDSSSSVQMMVAGEKNRALNARIDAYLSTLPERLLQAESKSPKMEAVDENTGSPPSPASEESSSIVDAQGTNDGKKGGMLGKWKKSKKFSRTLFK